MIAILQQRADVESVAQSIGEACHGSEILLVRVFVLRTSVILSAVLSVHRHEERHETFVRYRVVGSEPHQQRLVYRYEVGGVLKRNESLFKSELTSFLSFSGSRWNRCDQKTGEVAFREEDTEKIIKTR